MAGEVTGFLLFPLPIMEHCSFIIVPHSLVFVRWWNYGFHLIHFDRENTSFFPLSTSSLTSRMDPITCHRANELVSPNLEIAFMLLLATLPNRYCVTRILRNIPLIESFHTLAYRSETLFLLLLPLLLSSSPFSNTSIHLDHHGSVYTPLLQICIPVHTSSSHHISLPSSFAYLTHSYHHHLILLHLVIIISSSH